MSLLKIPRTKPSSVAQGVSVWEWSGSAFDEGEKAAKWFSDYLGKQSRWFETETRPSPLQFAPDYTTTFANTFPFIGCLSEPVPMNRFRPNIIVDNCDPFGEDLWDEVMIKELVFQGVVRLCSRSKVFFGKDMVWNWHITNNNNQGKGNKTIKVGDSISVIRKIPPRAEAPV
ncbi:hypothetical protein Bca4012_077904 [Brassica carinata]|uniref:MOSC domain-containing protein n=1 Tax=Brassica oleracea TaxID=3712 RepID=A0A3P6EDL4_BRAOL|nr:unnamed protein product [Brassica oleracea]